MDYIENQEEGEDEMNACVIKPKGPFVTKNSLKRTPATEENRKRVEFLDAHNFSLSIDKESLVLKSSISPKTE